jgi:hypothetical protein
MKSVFLTLCLISFLMPPVFADEEKDHNASAYKLNQARIDGMVDDFVRDVINHFLVKTFGDVMQKIIVDNQIQLFPQVAFQAAAEAAIQSFQQPAIKDAIWGIYDENIKQAKDEFSLGMPQSFIELGIRKRIERDLNLLVDDPTFRYVVEVMLEQAQIKQQRLIMMSVVQRQNALMSMEAEHQAQQMAVNQQISEAVKSSMIK